MRKRRNWLLGAAGLCVGGIFAALLYAPYLPRLLAEGYPQATWPAPGSFATVEGVPDAPVFEAAETAQPNARLRNLFEASDGRAILAARNGQLVMEHYAPGVTRETRLNSYSMIKSLVGALVLKAVAEDRIASLTTKIGTILTELNGTSTGDLALCRLLDMKSGIAFEPGGKKKAMGLDVKDLEASKLNVFGPMARLHMTGCRPRASPIGTEFRRLERLLARFSYKTSTCACRHIVSAPMTVRCRLLSEKIWKPAGAADATWRRYDKGLPVTPYCCLYARPLDWLRVAQFLLTNGRPEAPFLPPRLWRMFLGIDLPHGALHEGVYANFAYHNILDRQGEPLQGPFAYFFGSRGQTIYLMPEHDLVVARFGSKIQLLHSTLYGVGRSLGMGKLRR